MSLATRCTACGTIFRVVQDQLRVSEGWVRCGRCAEVFDARQQLFDMEREAPPSWTASQAMPLAPEVEAPPPVQPPPVQPPPIAARPSSFGALHEAAAEPVQAPLPPPPPPPPIAVPEPAPQTAAPVYESPEFDEEPAVAAPSTFETRIEPSFEANFTASVEDHVPDAEASMPAMPAMRAAEPAAPAPAEAAAPIAADETAPARKTKVAKGEPAATAENYIPSFMRHGQERERGARPRSVRAALIAGTSVLGVLLGLQAALHWRDAIAAAYPPARGALEALCGMGSCHVEPWRRIDVLSVENSALAQAGAGNQYQLTVSLRNKAGYEVALPWIDLSLTDPGGVVITRRALSPKDFRLGLDGKPVSLAAGAEQSLQVVLNTGEQKVSGYTVEIFNP